MPYATVDHYNSAFNCVIIIMATKLRRAFLYGASFFYTLKEVNSMPYKAKKPCAYHGCRELTANRYCDTHSKQEAKRYNKNDRDPDSNKRYGRTWKQIRAAFLSANPLCVMCQRDGRLIPATLAHHKIKLTDGGANDWENMVALCQECHSRHHAGQGDYF